MKKNEQIKNPYEAARKYLPPNSSICCSFDGTDQAEPEKKRSKLKSLKKGTLNKLSCICVIKS
jgi:hypothetical protein